MFWGVELPLLAADRACTIMLSSLSTSPADARASYLCSHPYTQRGEFWTSQNKVQLLQFLMRLYDALHKKKCAWTLGFPFPVTRVEILETEPSAVTKKRISIAPYQEWQPQRPCVYLLLEILPYRRLLSYRRREVNLPARLLLIRPKLVVPLTSFQGYL